jgi:hypothetical protein
MHLVHVSGWGHPKMPGVLVQHSGEDRRRVETGEAEPVQGTVPADEGQRVAVADHPVVADPVHVPPVLLSVALEPRFVGDNTIGTNAGSRPAAL